MTTAFQSNAFQNNAFQIGSAPPIVIDTHDGDNLRRRQKRWEEEAQARKRKKHEILAAYEYLVEGKSPIVEELVSPFVEQPRPIKGKERPPIINFDRMLGDVERIEQLWAEYLEMDDMEALKAMGLM